MLDSLPQQNQEQNQEQSQEQSQEQNQEQNQQQNQEEAPVTRRMPEGNYPYRRGRGRKLNVSAIKSAIVLASGGGVATLSGVTGIGATPIYAPILTWMLGFNTDKSQGTALTFAAWMSCAAVVGAAVGAGTPSGILWQGALLAIGGIIGAALLLKVSKQLQGVAQRRMTAGLGILLTLAVIVQASHVGGTFMVRPNLFAWNSPWQLLLLGIGVGGLTQLMGWASGTAMVPALFFCTGIAGVNGNRASAAVTLSLLVVAIASILPVLAYRAKGLVDNAYHNPMVIGGVLGGFAGGWLVGHLDERPVILVSAVVAMFLCARDLSRLANQSVSSNEDVSE